MKYAFKYYLALSKVDGSEPRLYACQIVNAGTNTSQSDTGYEWYDRLGGIVVKVSASRAEEQGSIPGRVIKEALKTEEVTLELKPLG